MEAYKFETTVLKNGIIQLPEISKFANCQIEIFIVIKQPDIQADTIVLVHRKVEFLNSK